MRKRLLANVRIALLIVGVCTSLIFFENSIRIEWEPDQLVYDFGGAFDPEGLEVVAEYDSAGYVYAYSVGGAERIEWHSH